MDAAGAAFLTLFLLIVAAAIGWILFTRLRASRLGLPPPPLTSYIPFYHPSAAATPYGPAQPAPGGVAGWVSDRIRAFKQRNARTAAGAYESATRGGGGGGVGRRGFGPLDPDDAWDARVGNEADAYGPGGYYEEQELGLAPQRYNQPHGGGGVGLYGNTEYTGSAYAMNLAATAPGGGGLAAEGDEEDARGRTASRSPRTERGAAATAAAAGTNPFDDDAADPSDMSLRGVSPRPIETGSGSAAAAEAHGAGKGHDSPTERKSIFREDV
ncbi:hypothetical protein P8C59_004784 [Phyllachora maydis]|uniref:Acid phosphatase-like protein n=1 Tax=Phyllachora maydis TaxID=1825666 RepID=A0AAD9MAT1_9PEZI|nr:hypothetical protein P8C59_004784 [Phyllachora maydis]